MKITIIAILSMLTFTNSTPALGEFMQDNDATPRRSQIAGFTIEPSMRMQGQNLPWEHEMQIALPPSYGQSDKSYPVLWATDGHWTFEKAIHAAASAGGHIPEMIIVAIGPPQEGMKESQMRRNYDFQRTSN